MEYFKRILKHYLVLALSEAGCRVDGDVIAEIEGACDALFDDLGLQAQQFVINAIAGHEREG